MTADTTLTSMKVNSLYNATESIMAINAYAKLDSVTLCTDLKSQLDSMVNGNTRQIEVMLITQAQTLNALFHFAVNRLSMSEDLPELNAYTDLIMKANNACRKSLLALNDIKNPAKKTVIQQQNNAIHQQVNHSHSATKKIIPKNELLSKKDNRHAPLDTRSKKQAIPINPTVATVEKSRR